MSSLLQQVAPPQGESTTSAPPATPRPAAMGRWLLLPAVLFCLDLLRLRVMLLFAPLPVNDFITYWAGGRLFLSGSNPYSVPAIYAIERSLGWSYVQPMVMLNPPWALPFVALLGVPPFRTAHFAWLAVSLVHRSGLLDRLMAVLWRREEQAVDRACSLRHLSPSRFGGTYGPDHPADSGRVDGISLPVAPPALSAGGACLLTLGLKPHLLYLVLLALLLWAIQTKRWSLAVSAIFFYASSTLAVIAFNHNVLDYFHGTVHAAMDTSCGVGGALRSIFGLQHAWLQFLPTAIGPAWFALYWIRNRRRWTWEEHLPLVLLVSLGTAPYSWAHDYILALPSFVALTVAISRTRTDWLVASGLYLVVQYFISNEAGLLSNAWMAAASLLWLVLYLIGTASLARTLPERAAQG